MNAPTYRPTCGTRAGAATHAANDEDPCGLCLEADDLARARHEARQIVPAARPVDTSLHEVIRLLDQLLTDTDRAAARKRRAA